MISFVQKFLSSTSMNKSLFVFAGSLVLAASMATAADKKAVTVYVEDFVVDPALRQDGGALATNFCAELSKDKSVDVVCGGDIRQLLDFGALQTMVGGDASGTNPAVTKRLSGVTVIVTGTVKQGKHGLISIISVTDRDPRFTGELLERGGTRGKIHVKGIKNGINGMTAHYPAWAKRAAAFVKGPAAGIRDRDAPEAKVIDDKARALDNKARALDDKARAVDERAGSVND